MFDVVSFSQYVRLAMKWFVGGLGLTLITLWATGLLSKVVRFCFGDLDEGEMVKFGMLSLCLGMIIGVYWMMRSAKDAIFFELVGKGGLPFAKMMTPFLLGAVLFVYERLVDRFPRKHQLFWVVCGFYSVLFTVLALIWKMNLPMMDNVLVNWIPGRIVGWLLFIGIETLGGIVVGAVFWAFVNSTTKTISAKKGYPLIVAGAQVGNFLGPAINVAYATVLGNANIILLAAGLLMLVPLIMEAYMHIVPAHLHESDDTRQAKPKKPGFFQGITLIASHPFLMGVGVVSTVYEAVSAIIDYQFKVLGSGIYMNSELTTFFSIYAMASALVAVIFSVFGASFFIRRFGVRGCLLGYPMMIGLTVIGLMFNPSLWSYFVAMIVVKAFSYSLNNPVKELLYLPTSKDIKFKAKGFIDGFGGKSFKAIGSSLNALAKENLFQLGSIFSLGIIAVWSVVAVMVGRRYDKLIEDKEIIE